MEPRRLASAVETCIPGMRVTKYRAINTGWENLVLEVNEEYIFRFPKFRGGWTRLREEMVLLPWLSRKMEVAIPDYEFEWAGSKRHPMKFAGYRKIKGVTCAEVPFNQRWIPHLSGELGRFLTELHSLRPPRDVLGLVPKHDRKAWAELRSRFHRRIRRLVYPLLDAKTRSWAEVFWADSLGRFSKADFEPVLIHSDMRSGNVILEPSTGGLAGIIDWGHAAVADPALDFMGIFEVSRRLGEETLDSYGKRSAGFMDRIELYLQTVPFGEVAWGVKTGDERLIGRGLKHLGQLSTRS